MSHIFISYTHADSESLDTLVEWLKNNEFTPDEIWYDDKLGSGSDWRDEITRALDESYVVLVIVTAASVKSLYCTYEWAYAMGQGIQILPLVFDEIPMAKVPAPLAAKQFANCKNEIPDNLKLEIIGLRHEPPQVTAINNLIYDALSLTHRRFFIVIWATEAIKSIEGDIGLFVNALSEAGNEAHKKLTELMIDRSAAFSRKQDQFCRQTMETLRQIARLDLTEESDTWVPERIISQFEETWLPAFEYFEGDKQWRTTIKPDFDGKLTDERTKFRAFAEIIRAFPDVNLELIHDLIDAKIRLRARRKSKTKTTTMTTVETTATTDPAAAPSPEAKVAAT